MIWAPFLSSLLGARSISNGRLMSCRIGPYLSLLRPNRQSHSANMQSTQQTVTVDFGEHPRTALAKMSPPKVKAPEPSMSDMWIDAAVYELFRVAKEAELDAEDMEALFAMLDSVLEGKTLTIDMIYGLHYVVHDSVALFYKLHNLLKECDSEGFKQFIEYTENSIKQERQNLCKKVIDELHDVTDALCRMDQTEETQGHMKKLVEVLDILGSSFWEARCGKVNFPKLDDEIVSQLHDSCEPPVLDLWHVLNGMKSTECDEAKLFLEYYDSRMDGMLQKYKDNGEQDSASPTEKRKRDGNDNVEVKKPRY